MTMVDVNNNVIIMLVHMSVSVWLDIFYLKTTIIALVSQLVNIINSTCTNCSRQVTMSVHQTKTIIVNTIVIIQRHHIIVPAKMVLNQTQMDILAMVYFSKNNSINIALLFASDIDECADFISGCNQVCSNTEGSYECSCYTGYTLDVSLRTCIGTIIIKCIRH